VPPVGAALRAAPARQHTPPRTYAYDAFALLQRACSYVYDAIVLPYITYTYATATTLAVITGTYQRTTTTTTTTAHSNCHNSKSGRKQTVGTPCSPQFTAFGASVPTYTYDYDGTIPQRNEPTAPTPTTTDSTTVTYVETQAIPPFPPALGTPTTNSGEYYYGYRFYSPELGRWPSRDPIGELGGVNPYSMLGNAAVSDYDVLGLYSVDDLPGDLYGLFLMWTYLTPMPWPNIRGGQLQDEILGMIAGSDEIAGVRRRIIGKLEFSCGQPGSYTTGYADRQFHVLSHLTGDWQLTVSPICEWSCSEQQSDQGCCCVCEGKCDVTFAISKTYTLRYTKRGNPANGAPGIRWIQFLRWLAHFGRDSSFFIHGDWTEEWPIYVQKCD